VADARPLSAGLGGLRPEILSSLERSALDWAGGSVQRLEDAFDEAFGVLPCDDDVLTSDVPPEIVPLVSSGLDGPHFGFLVMTPELGREDALVVSFGPARLVRPFAKSTREAFARLAELHAEEDDEIDPRLVQSLSTALDLPRMPTRAPSTFVPSVPVGYRWRPGRDGIGVVAAAAAFGPGPISDEPGLSLAEIDAWTSRLVYDGFPAAACAVLRDTFTLGHAQPATWDRLARSWASTYEALGRVGLAEQVRRRTARFG
jgi:hypothetical protein